MAALQAEAMEIPIIVRETEGEKEKELDDMKAALEEARMKFHIEGVVTGALFSAYQRDRVESVCDSLGLKVFSPLWKMDQEKEMRQLVDSGFEFVFSSVAAEGLDKSWLGRPIVAGDVDRLVALNKKVGINIAGEGGEFESLVLDGPMFRKKIKILDSRVDEESENTARFVVEKAELAEKQIILKTY
jgi:diphthine-ammonia ligase